MNNKKYPLLAYVIIGVVGLTLIRGAFQLDRESENQRLYDELKEMQSWTVGHVEQNSYGVVITMVRITATKSITSSQIYHVPSVMHLY